MVEKSRKERKCQRKLFSRSTGRVRKNNFRNNRKKAKIVHFFLDKWRNIMYNIRVTIKNLFVSASESNTKGEGNQDSLLHLTNPDDKRKSFEGKVGDPNKQNGK